MEEFIGKIWHRYITDAADKQFPDASIELDEVRHTMAIFFRALGGEGGQRIERALETDDASRRNILQRIAGSGKKTELAWRDEETLRLPEQIALFPEKQLNRDLYLWLTALSAIEVEADPHNWLENNRQRTLKTLQTWPGLKQRYRRLVKAHLLLRPAPESLPGGEAHQEQIIRQLLIAPDQTRLFTQAARKPPKPVPLWLHPRPPTLDIPGSTAPPEDPDAPEPAEVKQQKSDQKKRKQASRTNLPEGDGGLMSFRLESLWSWAEHVKVDRSSTEDDDDDAIRTAEDMDNISIAQDNETTAGKIKLDIDLPASAYDDIMLGEGVPVDEWDYRQQRMQKAHCRIQEMISRNVEATELSERLRANAHNVRRQFEVLRPQRTWVNRQTEGADFDLENYINFLADRKHGRVQNDTPVYRDLRNTHRDLSCLLLADLSLSTDAYISNHARVIDVVRDALFLFSEALHTTGDRFALHGFSSRNRNHVRFYNIKNFDEAYNPEVRGRIDTIKPGYYTRMGTAIRYATSLLENETTNQKLLLILTDGKPNDLDKYEGRYGIEDTRMAVLEAEQKGLRPFCVTIDEHASDYLPYLFGKQSYVVIHEAEQLPRKLPKLYLRLTK
jgi:nitric oxide reductase NorD protein